MSTRYSLYKSYNVVIDNVLRYNNTFNDHDLGAIVGYNQQYFNQYYFDASKQGLAHQDLTTLSFATTMTGINVNDIEHGVKSIFGPANFAYKPSYRAIAVIQKRRSEDQRVG